MGQDVDYENFLGLTAPRVAALLALPRRTDGNPLSFNEEGLFLRLHSNGQGKLPVLPRS